MNSKAGRAIGALLLGLAGASTHGAEAQSFRLNRFRAAERADDGFAVRRLSAPGHLRIGALLSGDYANDPLVIERTRGAQAEEARVVRHAATLKLDLTLALWQRLTLHAGLEALPLSRGPGLPVALAVPEADSAGLGDLSVGARALLLGRPNSLFALGAQATLIAPTAGAQAYRGEAKVAARPELIAELRPKRVRVTANVGALVREPQRLLGRRIDSELTYGLAVGAQVHRQVELLAELTGSFALREFGRRSTSSLEGLLGAKVRARYGLYVGAAGGAGFTHGIGTPDARAVAQLGVLHDLRASSPAPVAPARDRDHDGVLDPQDACIDAAEDRDGFRDDDGCPDSDDDQDGLLDGADRCRELAEDVDGFEDGDGCPDPDNDLDGVLDADDACPLEPGVADERGCPAKAPPPIATTVESELAELPKVHFENNLALILPTSQPSLQAVHTLLAQRGELTRLRIEGHTDSVGQDRKNLLLSRERAAAVGNWLIAHGIAPERLEAYGCGELHPLSADDTPEGRAQNRRVVFRSLDESAQAPSGCERVDLQK